MDDIPAKASVQPADADAASDRKPQLRVVGVCAGAGGLEAIQLLFGGFHVDADLAFVVCRRVREGLPDPLEDLLSAQTAMPVIEAENGTRLEAGRIHLIAPDAPLVLLRDRLVSLDISDEPEGGPAVSPIDLLLHSMAASLGSAAIAVILSGNDRDGQRGAASIRDHGGLVLAQLPESTDFADMPCTIIDADLASAVAPPGAMPDLIWRHVGKMQKAVAEGCNGGSDDEALMRITALLDAKFAIDARAYRPSLLARHLHRRIVRSETKTLADYADLVAKDDAELSALHDDLLIRVTAFFRDPEAFTVLEREVVPVLVERMSQARPIRVWVPACASGEEAYSLAMLLLDRIELADKEPHLEVLASDRHAPALKGARFGRYRRDRLGATRQDLIERYMQGDGKRVEAGPLLRRHVTFVDHDILKAPPPDDIDLVSCRNLLIYLAAASREEALEACSLALRPDGFLFLGPCEQPGRQLSGLATIDGKWRVYRKIPPPPVDDALARLSKAKIQAPAEALALPDMDAYQPPPPPDGRVERPGELDGVMAENQRMLESTIDTLLASNDTLRKRNRDLRAENQRLAGAHAALDDIATMIAHDLKAPLRAIDHLAGGLKTAFASDDADDDPAHWLQPMQHQLTGLNRLIDDLLTYARQGPTDGADLQSVDVGDLLRETLTLIGLPKGIKVLMRPPSLQVRTWRIPLACILRNLLSQAIDRIGAASGNIQIEAKPTDHLLEITISDDGRNVGDEKFALGLAIVRQLLDGAGGRLASSTNPSALSHTVSFTWPIEGEFAPETKEQPSPSA